MLDVNTDKTHKKAARIDDLLLGHNHVEGSGLNRSSVVFDYSSKRAQKDAQRVARPPRVQRFSNGMVLIERDNETPEFISCELFAAQYGNHQGY